VTRAALASVHALWWREIIRFMRQRSRLVGAFAQPLVFWLLLGGGFSASFRPPGMPADVGAMQYFYPGIITLVLLFTGRPRFTGSPHGSSEVARLAIQLSSPPLPPGRSETM